MRTDAADKKASKAAKGLKKVKRKGRERAQGQEMPDDVIYFLLQDF